MRLFWWFSSTVFLLISFWAKKSSCAANLKQLIGGVAEDGGKGKSSVELKEVWQRFALFDPSLASDHIKDPHAPIAFYREAHIRWSKYLWSGGMMQLALQIQYYRSRRSKVKADTFSPSYGFPSCWSNLLKKLLIPSFIIDVSFFLTSWKLN